MILMNPAPASTEDYKQLRKEWLEKRPDDMERRKTISASAAYQEGDPDAVIAYYRIHFQPAAATGGLRNDYRKAESELHKGRHSQVESHRSPAHERLMVLA